MNRDKIITAAVAAAVAVGVVALVRDGDVGQRPADTRKHRKHESKLVELEDGGRGYAYPTTFDCDGGTEWVRADGGTTPIDIGDAGVQIWKTATCTEYLVTDVAPCVRAREDAGMCWRTSVDGGAAFFGFDNRFPREEMHPSSTRCQPVACSVVAGEDAEEDEDAHLARERKQRKGQ